MKNIFLVISLFMVLFGASWITPASAAWSEEFIVRPGQWETKIVYLEYEQIMTYQIQVSGGQNNDIKFSIDNSEPQWVNGVTVGQYVAERTGDHWFKFNNDFSTFSSKNIEFSYNIVTPVPPEPPSYNPVLPSGPMIWFIILSAIIVAIGSVIGYAIKKRNSNSSSMIDNKPSSGEPPKKSFLKGCSHSDSWIREDNVEICSSCGKELNELISKTDVSKSKDNQQNLDSYVTTTNIDKETINDIEKNEKVLGILKERLAKGEITIEEFQHLKKEISG